MDKKLYDQINRGERIKKVITQEKRRAITYLDQEPDGYLLPENENEKTLKLSQDALKQQLPKYNRDNIFDLALNYGSYTVDFTPNGSTLLIAGEKGHLALLDWRNKDLISEFRVDEKVQTAKFLHNDTMIAVAQKSKLFIYDKQGLELHALDYHPEPKYLEFLPYHFLLVSGLKNSMIKYQDVTIGQIVSEIKTKNGEITSMCQNPYNAVICTGHSNGTVNMWTPNFGSDPVVKILAHPFSVNTMCVDPTGKYLITSGSDSKMKVWDLRNSYKELFEYFNPLIATSAAVSQKGLLAISQGSVVEIWNDYYKEKQKEPYMKHHYKNNQTKTKSMKFIPFEDFLGLGTNFGYSSIVVPGSGESNFDTFENNPYETKNQRKNKEIKQILEKIPYNMISLDPNNINKVDPRSKSIIDKERKEEAKKKADELVKNQKKKMKQRLSNKERHELILKEFNKNQAIRNKLRAMIEIQTDKKNQEKEKVKSEVKVLKMLQDDFDPEVYIQKKSDEEENDEDNYDDHIE